MTITRITPRLFIRDIDAALRFYEDAMGATLLERYDDEKLGITVHAAIQFGTHIVAIAQEHEAWGNLSPLHLKGSPVFLNLETDDADGLGASMVAQGAEVIIPIEDRFYGKREGRLRDPAGHYWIVSQPLEDLDPAEIRARM